MTNKTNIDKKSINQKIKEYNAGKMIPMKFFWVKMLVMFGPVLILGIFFSEEFRLGMGNEAFNFFKSLNQGIMMFVTGFCAVIFTMYLAIAVTFSDKMFESARKKNYKEVIEKQKPFMDAHMRVRSLAAFVVYGLCICIMYSMALGILLIAINVAMFLFTFSRVEKEKKWFVEFLDAQESKAEK